MVETLFCWECLCRQPFTEVSADVFACLKCGLRRDLVGDDSYEV